MADSSEGRRGGSTSLEGDRAGALTARITRAAGVYAVERTSFYRGNLARAMRRAIAAGLDHDHVIALSVLPREEAERLMGSPL